MSAAAAVGGASTSSVPEYTITPKEKGHYIGCKKALKFPTAEAEFAWARTQIKACSKCDTDLPLTCYAGNTSGSDPFDSDGYRRHRPECLSCTKKAGSGKTAAAATAKRLGMPIKPPAGTPCELCGKTDNIVFDHDHETDTFRGWLCNPCNRSIGVLGDDVAGLIKVLNYVNRAEKRVLKVDSSGWEVLTE